MRSAKYNLQTLATSFALLSGIGLTPTFAAPVYLNWQNAALQEGGLGLSGNNLWANPATLEIPQRQFFEAGVQLQDSAGSTESSKILTLWGSGISSLGKESAISFAFTQAPTFQIAGASRLFSGTWVGILGKWDYSNENPIDLGFGVHHRINTNFQLGWVGRNLTTDPSTQKCTHCISQGTRELGLGAAYYFDQKENLALYADLFHPELTFWHTNQLSLNTGFRTFFGTNRNVQLASGIKTIHVTENMQMQGSAGLVFQQYFFSTLVSLRYAVNQIPIISSTNATNNLTHQASIGVVWNAFVDKIAPLTFVRATKALLVFTDTKQPQELDFLLRIEDDSKEISHWSLVIYTAKADLGPGTLVRKYSAQGLPPKSILWKGDDLLGVPCRAGVYAYRLIATDAAGNQSWTDWQHIEIR